VQKSRHHEILGFGFLSKQNFESILDEQYGRKNFRKEKPKIKIEADAAFALETK
jgi:hypothetical protein